MQVKKQQLKLDMKQQTASRLGKEYIKAIYCLPHWHGLCAWLAGPPCEAAGLQPVLEPMMEMRGSWGFPGGSAGKESACTVGET